MEIPQIFHRVWLGENEIPDEYEEYWQGWKKIHPDWTFLDWNNGNIKDLSLYYLANEVNCPAAASDIVRYEVVYQFGGVYIDCDFECKKPIDNLIKDKSFVVCNQVNEFSCYCSNGFFAALPKHKILKKAIEELQELDAITINNSEPANITGPYFFRRVINNSKVDIVETINLYPYLHLKKELYQHDASKIYAIHKWGGSWLPLETLLWLAKKQYSNGDYIHCLETCKKTIKKYNDNRATLLLQKTYKKVRIQHFIYIFCRVFLLNLLLKFLQFSATFRSGSNLPKILTKIKNILIRASQFIYNKTSKIQISKLQYNHVLEYIFSQSNKKTVVEIGAMDGKSFDKLYPYLKNYCEITALLIEPLSDNFIQLKENYKDFEENKNNFFYENIAVTEKKGEVEISRISHESIELNSLPDWTRGISSLKPEKNSLLKDRKIYSDGKNLSDFITIEKVKSDTLANIFQKYLIKDIDVLQIDTEGFDYIILQQALQLAKPKVICFEWINLSESEKIEAVNLLKKNDYVLSMSLDYEDMLACSRKIYYQLNEYVYVNYSVCLLPH